MNFENLERDLRAVVAKPSVKTFIYDLLWVRLFRVALDGSDSDHLTSRKCGRDGGSGLGTALLA